MPDSILVKLMFVEVVYDDPFPSDEAVARVETLATAELTSGAGRSDLKVAKALARDSFDEHILMLPFFPDINRHQKTEELVAAMRGSLKESYDQICNLLRHSSRFMQQQAVGNAGAEVAEGVSGKAADDLVRLESFITIRENNHQYHRVAKQASIKQIAQQKELEEHKRNQEYARVNLDLRRREEEANRRRAAAIEAAKERARTPRRPSRAASGLRLTSRRGTAVGAPGRLSPTQGRLSPTPTRPGRRMRRLSQSSRAR